MDKYCSFLEQTVKTAFSSPTDSSYWVKMLSRFMDIFHQAWRCVISSTQSVCSFFTSHRGHITPIRLSQTTPPTAAPHELADRGFIISILPPLRTFNAFKL